MSAWNCMSVSLATMPPSTRSSFSSTPESAFIASTTSRDWKAVASSTARAMCPLLTYRVRPTSAPRASDRQYVLAGLESGGLQHRPRDVSLVDVPRQAHERPARVRPPVRGEQAGERRHEVGATVVLDLGRELLDLRGRGDDPEVVAEPLHERAGDGDGALEAVHLRGVTDLVAHRGQQAVLAVYQLSTGVEQQEVARAVGVLRAAHLEACLPEGGRLLVAEDAGDRGAGQHTARPSLAVHLGRGADLGKHGHRDAHVGGDVLVPGE